MPNYSKHIFRRIICIVAMIALSACIVPAGAQNSKRIRQLQQQQAQLKKQLNESEKLLRANRKDVRSQLKSLNILNGQIGEQQKLVDGIQVEVTSLSNDIGTLSKQLSALRADLDRCKMKYRRAVLYMNRNRLLQNKWTFIFMAKNFRDMYRRMRYAKDYSKYMRIQGEIIRRKEQAVAQKQEELRAAKAGKDQMLVSARQAHADLEGQKTQRQAVVNDLNKRQGELQREISRTKQKQRSINARIDQLIKQEIAAAEARRKRAEAARRAAEARRRREAEAKRQAEAARQRAASRRSQSKSKTGKRTSKTSKRTSTPEPVREPKRPTYNYAEEDAADRTISGSFAANRGRLPVPITGSYAVTSRYGQYNVEGLRGVTLDSKGINLTGRPGAQARSVFKGEVSAVANVGGTYVVIVRHGSYYSVYSNLRSVSVRRGQEVGTRQTLGSVASDGAGGATLHFQLRRKSGNDASPFNPLPWLGR